MRSDRRTTAAQGKHVRVDRSRTIRIRSIGGIVPGGGEHGIDGIAGCMGEMIATHAIITLEMVDHQLDGGAACD
jgi:hypothetical protein